MRAAWMPDPNGQETQKGQNGKIRKHVSDMDTTDQFALGSCQALSGRSLHPLHMPCQRGGHAACHVNLEIDPAMPVIQLGFKVSHPGLVAEKLPVCRAEADFEHALVGRSGMIVVAVELFGGQLPVAAQIPAVQPGQGNHAAFSLVEDEIEIPLHIPEVGIQALGVLVETGKDEAPKRFHAGHFDQTPVLPVELLVIGFFELRHTDEPTLVVIRPAVVGAGKRSGVAGVQAAHARAAMAAGVQKDPDFSACRPADQDRLLAHIVGNEVARIRELGFMRQIEPTAAEDSLLFVPVDLFVNKDPRADCAFFQVNQVRPVHRAMCSFNSLSP